MTDDVIDGNMADDVPDDEMAHDKPDDEQDKSSEQDPADELGFSFDDDPDDVDDEKESLRQEIRRLQKQLGETKQDDAPQLRNKPTLDDFDYDSEAYIADLEQWYQEKADYDNAIKSEQSRYQKYDDRYAATSTELRNKVQDYDKAEQVIVDALSVQKQASIKMLVDDPAKMVYLLAKSPKRLDELTKLDDVAFVKQIVLMEQQMTTKNRNPNKPKPKTHELTGGAGGGDGVLARLEAEAEQSGDRTKVVAYLKQLKNKTN